VHTLVQAAELELFSSNCCIVSMDSGDVGSCKGVRCPPIFSLSNLINVGWQVRKCVDIYIHPLIAGTNRKTFCCMLALR